MTAPKFDDALVDSLFPAPNFAAAFTNPAVPAPNAGITPESTAALRRLLIENHKRFHVFFKNGTFHNHLSHHLFAAYGIGAPAHVLQKAFDEHASYQLPAYQSPEPITYQNWMKDLGNEDFYNAYMGFFTTEIKKYGVATTFKKYVLSDDANWGLGQPRMLDRFISGVVHSMIHFGHYAEFGIDGMAVEGLAQTAVHASSLEHLFDATFFAESTKTTGDLSSLTPSLSLSESTAKGSSENHIHSFSILARMLADDRLKAGVACKRELPLVRFEEVLRNVGGIIREYAALWTIKEDEKEIQERVEELNWLVTLLFGVGGWKKDRAFRADFFLVHLVTSNLFLPSILSLLKLKHRVNFMRAYFANAVLWFVTEGRPDLDLPGFFESVTLDPKPNHDSKSLAEGEAGGDPWYTLLAHTLAHPDEHHVKAERALAHGAALYGARPKGYFAHTGLKGAELIDGSLFVRTGGLLMDAMRWSYRVGERAEGIDEGSGWDRAGLGWN
ncbi:Oxidoreductase AflY [Rhizoctonia solani]|uniref:Oxidoreductase AflY n=1 Tax=Rhizoctonia solani TaxID=456999 RepID=A0A0K6G413_9AGAM|nr:Oxidoreductase AflY [Rhizoctonia solani]